MEEWQVQYIQKHCKQLYDFTAVNTLLLVTLFSKGVLCDFEVELLNTTSIELEKAKKLYTIIQTKEKGFKALLESLYSTRQTGAHKILAGALIDASDLTNSQYHKLQHFKIRWHGAVVALGEVFPGALKDIYFDIKQNVAFVQHINNNLLQDCLPLSIIQDIPSLNPVYITRHLSRRLVVSLDIFKENCEDIFVVKGGTFAEFFKLSRPHRAKCSDSQLHKIVSRHIYLTHDDHLEYIIAKAGDLPVHFIRCEGDKYILVETTQVTGTIRKHTARFPPAPDSTYLPNTQRGPLLQGRLNQQSQTSNQIEKACFSEDEFIENLLYSETEKGFFICDSPGMGKSWFLLSCARKLQSHGLNCVTFFVRLSEFSEYLLSRSVRNDPHSVIKAMIEYCGCPNQSELSVVILRHIITSSNHKTVMFFDGFDEIVEQRRANTKLFLQAVTSINYNIKICVSSRKHTRKELEDALMIYSYDMLPFTREDTIITLVLQWSEVRQQRHTIKLREFSEKCLKKCSQLTIKGSSGMLGIPLVCYMLATIYQDDAVIYSKSDNTNSFLPADITTVCQLFELYIKYGHQKLLKRLPNIDNQICENVLRFHKFMALKVLFPGFDTNLCNVDVTRDLELRCLVPSFGILLQSENPTDSNNFTFIHRSFAEYFVSKMIVDYWKHALENGFEHSQTNIKMECFFFENVFKTSGQPKPGLPSVCLHTFFDCYICRDSYELVHDNLIRLVSLLLSESRFTENTRVHNCFDRRFNQIYWLLLCSARNDLVGLTWLLVKIVNYTYSNSSAAIDCTHDIRHDTTNNSWTLHKPLSDEHIALLLHTAARWSSFNLTEELFKITVCTCGKNIQKFCCSYPNDLATPLIPAIESNNVELVQAYSDILPLLADTLFPICLRFWHTIEDERARRNEICSVLISQDPTIFFPENCDSILIVGLVYDQGVMKYISSKHNLDWRLLPFFLKLYMLDFQSVKSINSVVQLFFVLFMNDFEPKSCCLMSLGYCVTTIILVICALVRVFLFLTVAPVVFLCCMYYNYKHAFQHCDWRAYAYYHAAKLGCACSMFSYCILGSYLWIFYGFEISPARTGVIILLFTIKYFLCCIWIRIFGTPGQRWFLSWLRYSRGQRECDRLQYCLEGEHIEVAKFFPFWKTLLCKYLRRE